MKNGTIVQPSAEEAREMMARGSAGIDHARLDALSEEELEASIDYEDEGRFEDWKPIDCATTDIARHNASQIDRDVLDWFAAKGPDYAHRINDVLRDYIKSQETMSSAAD